VVRIGSPEPKPDGKGKLRKVDVGPAPAPVVFDPTHRAAVAANIGLTGELRTQCDAAFQDINKGFLTHNIRMDAIKAALRTLVEQANIVRTAVQNVDGNVRGQFDILGGVTDGQANHQESIIKLGKRMDDNEDNMRKASECCERLGQHDERTDDVLKTIVEQLKQDLTETVGKTLDAHNANFKDVKAFGMVTEVMFQELQVKFTDLEEHMKTIEAVAATSAATPLTPPGFGMPGKAVGSAFVRGKTGIGGSEPSTPPKASEAVERVVSGALSQVFTRFEGVDAEIRALRAQTGVAALGLVSRAGNGQIEERQTRLEEHVESFIVDVLQRLEVVAASAQASHGQCGCGPGGNGGGPGGSGQPGHGPNGAPHARCHCQHVEDLGTWQIQAMAEIQELNRRTMAAANAGINPVPGGNQGNGWDVSQQPQTGLFTNGG
jgi:uncharacterized low-complexity protein